MKRPYEKPTLIDLSLPTARAGWLPGGGASPQGFCENGNLPADPRRGNCQGGSSAGFPTGCNSGQGAAPQNFCTTGTGGN
jgi:hypothetical protein